MAELKTKNLIVQIGETKYKMVGSKLEYICAELGISEERFVELLARDFYCPTLTAAPTSSTLTYTDSDGSVNHFQVGQPCRWADGSDYRMALCKNISETAAAWYVLPTKVSELTNDSKYVTSDGSLTDFKVVNALPDSPNATTMYVVLKS